MFIAGNKNKYVIDLILIGWNLMKFEGDFYNLKLFVIFINRLTNLVESTLLVRASVPFPIAYLITFIWLDLQLRPHILFGKKYNYKILNIND